MFGGLVCAAIMLKILLYVRNMAGGRLAGEATERSRRAGNEATKKRTPAGAGGDCLRSCAGAGARAVRRHPRRQESAHHVCVL